MASTNASGYAGLENTPLARVGYHNTIIARHWDADIIPYITNTEIDERILQCVQTVQLVRQPYVGPWKPYNDNQQLVPDQIRPEGFCFEICNYAYKAIKVDAIDVKRMCERWDSWQASFTDSAYQALASQWRSFVLSGMVLGASPRTKGSRAGRACNVNLGAPGTPISLTSANIVPELSKLKMVLQEQNMWQEGKMVLIIPPAVSMLVNDSRFADAGVVGACNDCSIIVTGRLSFPILGATVFETNSAPAVIDPVTQDMAYYVILAHREAFAFAGDILAGEIKDSEKSFGKIYRMLAAWGGKAIYPEGIAVLYVQVTL